MSDFKLMFFGWYYLPSNNNDKIWGYAKTSFGYASFWGKRSPDGSIKSIKFKKHSDSDGEKLRKQAINKATPEGYSWSRNYNPDTCYKPVSLEVVDGVYTEVEKVYPNFVSQMKKQLFTALLTNKIM